ALFAREDRRKHDAIVVHARLGTENHDVETVGIAGENFLHCPASGHAVSDYDKLLAPGTGLFEICRCVHIYLQVETQSARKKAAKSCPGGETGGDIATLCCCSRRSRHSHPAVGAPDSAMRANYLMAAACRKRFFALQQKPPDAAETYQLT